MDTERENEEENEVVTCADCGCELDVHSAHDLNVDGDPICEGCSEEYCECADCGEVIRRDSDYQDDDNNPICESCSDNYRTCDTCGKVMRDCDSTWIESEGEIACDYCLGRYFFRCADCGDYVADGNQIELANGDYICEHCRCNGAYFTCERCGDTFHYDECNDCNGDLYCDDCHSKYINQAIHDYSYKPEWIHHQTAADRAAYPCINDRFYFGIELEVANKGRRHGNSDVAANVADMVPAVCKHDSSIRNGFEIVFHPQTFSYATTEGKPAIENMLDYLRNKGFAGHNYGGIHVHLSLSAFTRLHLFKFHILFLQCDNLLTLISQRKAENLRAWASFGNMGEIPGHHYKRGQKSRYAALNYTRHTVEVRIFNSTVRTDRFFKNIEAIKAALDFSKQYGIYNMCSADFLCFIVDNHAQYKNLVAFLVEHAAGTLMAANVDAKVIRQVQKKLSRRTA